MVQFKMLTQTGLRRPVVFGQAGGCPRQSQAPLHRLGAGCADSVMTAFQHVSRGAGPSGFVISPGIVHLACDLRALDRLAAALKAQITEFFTVPSPGEPVPKSLRGGRRPGR